MNYFSNICRNESDSLSHHGVKGMHWGVRRYQNYDGTLTAAGKHQAVKTKKPDSKKVSTTNKKKRAGLTKTQKDLLRGAALAVGTGAVAGGVTYAVNKRQLEKEAEAERAFWDKYKKQEEEYQKARQERAKQRAQERKWASDSQNTSGSNSSSSNNRSNSNTGYRSKTSTASNKSKDRSKQYEGQNINYESAKKRVDNLRDKVAKAQKDGTVTAEMIDELQDAMAQVKVARKNMKHGIWFINNRNSLMHSVCRVTRRYY